MQRSRRRWRRAAPGVVAVEAPNGEELLPPLLASARLRPSAAGPRASRTGSSPRPSAATDATRLRAWTDGQRRPARSCTGCTYFPALADAPGGGRRRRPGAVRRLAGRRRRAARDDGPTVGEALAGRRAARGTGARAAVALAPGPCSATSRAEPRRWPREVNAAGGEVLLDQRIRPLGSHHQKLVVVRHRDRARATTSPSSAASTSTTAPRRRRPPRRPATGRRPTTSTARSPGAARRPGRAARTGGPRPRRTSSGERWDDPARAGPAALAHRSPTGSTACRRTAHAAARRRGPTRRKRGAAPCRSCGPTRAAGPRTRSRRSASAASPAPTSRRCSRAQRLVYVEDQYLWSFDVARIFAAALRRAPRLPSSPSSRYRTDEKDAGRTGGARAGRGDGDGPRRGR